MQIGWIDFSKQDKSNALNVIQSLNEPGVLDELGFGIIRNAFANDFFPGTSTLHTRSKYLYLIVNILYEFQKNCVDGKYSAIGNAAAFIKKIKEDIDYEEKAVKNVLLKKGDLEGVIGSSSTDEKYWVERTPLIIYWSALRTFNFFENSEYSKNITYSELLAHFYRISQAKKNQKSVSTNTDSEEKNDTDAGGTVFYPIGKEVYDANWRNDVQIKLTKVEALDLRKRMIESEQSKDSLLAYILKEDLKVQDLGIEQFLDAYKSTLPEKFCIKLELAKAFNDFYYLTMLRYNYLLAKVDFQKCNLDLETKWKEIEDQIVTICESFDIEKTFFVMNIQNEKLRNFLRDLRTDFIEAYNNKDYSKVDELIKRREGNLKTNRAKIDHPEKYDVSKLLEYPKFDFRFGIVQRHIKDIQEGENA